MIFLRFSLLALCLLLGLAKAQRLSFQSGGVVSFEASEADIKEALSCTQCKPLNSAASSSSIALRVQRQGSKAYVLTVRQASTWTAFRIEARYTISPRQANSYTTDWLELGAFAQTVYSGNSPVTDISVEYRLWLTGEELAGVLANQIIYSVDSSSINHLVQVASSAVALVKIKGQSSSSLSLKFDYGGLNAASYMSSLETGKLLEFTESTLDAVYVYTNNPKGATIKLELFVQEKPENADPVFPQILLFGEPLMTREFKITQPTADFELLLSPQDFSLKVNGSEMPGTYLYVLRYLATVQP